MGFVDKKSRTPEVQAALDAFKRSIGPALVAALNYNVALKAAGDDPTKWTAEQAAALAKLRAELEAANKAS